MKAGLKTCLLLGGLLCWHNAQAITCRITGTPVVDFGDLDPFVGGNRDVLQTINWTCDKPVLGALSATMCVYATRGDASTTGSITPRQMRHSSGTPLLTYNLYRDATRTQIIGQSGETVNQGLAIPVNFSLLGCVVILACSTSGTATIYGRLFGPLPANSKAGPYTSNMNLSRVSVISGTTAGNCDNQNLAASTTYTLQARANMTAQCRVTATNMAFGTHGLLTSAVDATSTVSVRCSNETSFSVTLNNGQHALSGQRRMQAPGNNQLPYELYRNTARTQRWGTASAESVTGVGLGTASIIDLTVYGRVPANTLARPGAYSDTITVQVTF